MSSKTNICNQALLLLGESVISDIDEGTTQADTCKVFYDSSKGATLQDHDWNFAMARATFSLDATTPAYEWDYRHVLPSDCLRVVEIDSLEHDQWQVEGRYLLSDLATIKGRYVRNDVAEGEFTPMFVKTLAAYLAHELAYPICESSTKSREMLGIYENRKEQAGTVDNLEGSTKRTSEARLISVR